jgi:hypothetical protein
MSSESADLTSFICGLLVLKTADVYSDLPVIFLYEGGHEKDVSRPLKCIFSSIARDGKVSMTLQPGRSPRWGSP